MHKSFKLCYMSTLLNFNMLTRLQTLWKYIKNVKSLFTNSVRLFCHLALARKCPLKTFSYPCLHLNCHHKIWPPTSHCFWAALKVQTQKSVWQCLAMGRSRRRSWNGWSRTCSWWSRRKTLKRWNCHQWNIKSSLIKAKHWLSSKNIWILNFHWQKYKYEVYVFREGLKK